MNRLFTFKNLCIFNVLFQSSIEGLTVRRVNFVR